MADLAKLALVITADAQSFENTLKAAAKGANDFVSKVTSYFSNLGSNLLGALGATAANPFGAVVAGATAAIAAFTELQAAGNKMAVQQAELTRRFGLTGEAAAGLAMQARIMGVDAGGLNKSLMAVSVRLSEAASQGGPAADALTKIGLNAQALTETNIQQALAQIGDGLKGVHNAGERSALTWAILGRRGQELERIMRDGSAGMREAQYQAVRLGVAFSDADAKTIKSAQKAQRTADEALHSLWQGMANSVAVSGTPLTNFVAELKLAFVELVQGPLYLVKQAIFAIGSALQYTVSTVRGWLGIGNMPAARARDLHDSLEEVPAAVKAISDRFTKLLENIENVNKGIKQITAGLNDQNAEMMGGPTPQIAAARRQIEEQRAALESFAAQAMSQAAPQASVTVAVAEAEYTRLIRVAALMAQRAVVLGAVNPGTQAALDELAARWATYRDLARDAYNAALAAEAAEAAVIAGIGTAAQQEAALMAIIAKSNLANAEKRIQELEAAQQLNDILKERDRILNGLLTPLDKFNETIESIQQQMELGMIWWEDGLQAIGQAFEQLDKQQQKSNEVKLAGGLTSGSAAAMSLINQASITQSAPSNDPVERLRQLQVDNNTMAQERTTNGRLLLGAVGRLVDNQPAVIGL